VTDDRNVFISHIHEDDERVGQLKDLLAKKGMVVRDGSITSDKFNDATSEDYIKGQILAPRIRWASVLVVLISSETRNSDYVNWEIEYAEREGKRIVGVWTPGEADSDLPVALEEYADAIVGWNGDRVVEAIEGAERWERSDGSARPAQLVPRHNCRRARAARLLVRCRARLRFRAQSVPRPLQSRDVQAGDTEDRAHRRRHHRNGICNEGSHGTARLRDACLRDLDLQ
jgi:hypothetical protein